MNVDSLAESVLEVKQDHGPIMVLIIEILILGKISLIQILVSLKMALWLLKRTFEYTKIYLQIFPTLEDCIYEIPTYPKVKVFQVLTALFGSPAFQNLTLKKPILISRTLERLLD